MSELRGPAYEQALRGMAADITSRKPVRRLWVYLLPGLTAESFTEAAKAAGVPILPGKEFLAWHDVSITSGKQWEAIREYCATKLGADPEALERPDVTKFPAYRSWLAELRAWQQAKGIDPMDGSL